MQSGLRDEIARASVASLSLSSSLQSSSRDEASTRLFLARSTRHFPTALTPLCLP